jgi:hypothetical protein
MLRQHVRPGVGLVLCGSKNRQAALTGCLRVPTCERTNANLSVLYWFLECTSPPDKIDHEKERSPSSFPHSGTSWSVMHNIPEHSQYAPCPYIQSTYSTWEVVKRTVDRKKVGSDIVNFLVFSQARWNTSKHTKKPRNHLLSSGNGCHPFRPISTRVLSFQDRVVSTCCSIWATATEEDLQMLFTVPGYSWRSKRHEGDETR